MSVQVSYKKQTIFFIILILITLVIAEGFVRSLDLVNVFDCAFVKQELFKNLTNLEKESICREYTNIEYDDFSDSIRLLQPNQQGQYININSEGFRGKELSFESDDYKIFFLGGSTAFGHVSSTDDYTIPALLEKKLKDAELNVKVVNAGVPGATSMDERYYVEKYLTNYSPDMIIMYDGWNDGGSHTYTYTYDEFKNQSFHVNRNVIVDDNGMRTKTGIVTFFTKIDYKTGIGVTQALHDLLYQQNKVSKEIILEKNISKIEDRLQNNWSKICEMGLKNNFQTINILQPIFGTSNRTVSISENFHPTGNELHIMALKLNDVQYHPCDKVYDLRNVFDGMDETPIYFDYGHMGDFGNEIVANKIYEQILPTVLEDISK